jgi:hypothetical protein
MSRTRSRIATLGLAVVTAGACAQDAGLSAWVGRHPSDEVTAKGGTLLSQPRLHATLKAILPKAEAARLRQFDTESIVTQSGDFLVIDQCRPHLCPADAAMIVVDLRSTRVWAAFFSRSSTGLSTRWYANVDDYDVLPQDIQAQFLKQHASIAP